MSYLDIRGDQFRDGRVGAAEHHVLARCVELVVGDLKGPRAVPSGDRLSVVSNLVEVRHGRVDDRLGNSIERHAAPVVLAGVAVYPTAVDHDFPWELRAGSLRPRAQPEHAGVLADTRSDRELDADQAPLVGAWCGIDCAVEARTDDAGHVRGVARPGAGPFRQGADI